MAGFYWYCILAVVGVGITVFILYKKKNFYELISFFLFAMMAVFIVEMIVLLFLDGYSYKPGNTLPSAGLKIFSGMPEYSQSFITRR